MLKNRPAAALCKYIGIAWLGACAAFVCAEPDNQEPRQSQDLDYEDDFAVDGDDGAMPAIHATRLDYSEFEAPEAVTVITREDIRLVGYLEVSEIFRAVPGFRIAKVGDQTWLSYHGTTLIQNRRMKVTIDGRSVLIGDGAYVEFDRLPIDLEDIARVTITRGPNGAALGDNAFLASIDFTTISKNDPHGIGISVGGGYNDRKKVGITVNESVGGFHIALSANTEEDGGYDFSDDEETPRNDGKKIDRARITIERDFNPRSTWIADASIYDSEHEAGQPTIRFTGEQTNEGQFFALTNRRELGESSRLDWFISHNQQEEYLLSGGCYTPDTIAGIISVTDPADLAGALAPTLFVPQLLGVPLHDTCFITDLGIESNKTEFELEYESRRGPLRYLLGASASTIDARSDQWFGGIEEKQDTYRGFGEAAYTIGKFHLSAGVMAQDSNNIVDAQTAWRAAINWQLRPNHMLRYSYTSSFRVPALVETETRYTSAFFFGRRDESLSTYQFSLPLPDVTNPVRVKPETIQSHAVGYFGTFLNSRLTSDLKVFEEQINDSVETNSFSRQLPPANKESFKLRGAETEFSYKVTEWFKLAGHYSYLDNDSQRAYEQGLHGDHAGSLTAICQLAVGHAFSASYYGNSAISGNTYDRYDLVYNFAKSLGNTQMKVQLIFQHHVGGVDGIDAGESLSTDEGHFKDLNQAFLYLEVVW
ncbi:MAG: TonB-dependent receptor plug domain-containing protein [Pseudomonadales bacterium]